MTRNRNRIRIGDLLIEHGAITEDQLKAALSVQKQTGQKLGRTLIESGMVDEIRLLTLLSEQLSIPFIDLKIFPIQIEVARRIPETIARRHRAIPMGTSKDGHLLIGMADPTNLPAYDELCRLIKAPIDLAVVRESELLQVIDNVYQGNADIGNLASEVEEDVLTVSHELIEELEEKSDAPIMRLIGTLFESAVVARASDIHIEPDEKVLRIRRRIDGVLQEQIMDEKAIAPALVSRLKLMAGLDISERRLPQDGRFKFELKERSIDVRFSTMPTQHGESVVMRLLDHSDGVKGLDQIGLNKAAMEKLQRAIHRPHGLLLVTGPTGSGKTTTLYAALSDLNHPERKIITVEDPVEYRLPRVNQVQVNPKIGLDFARVLRTTLRQDPDIILIGEIRDSETAEIALRASITGHLVMSTLHTNDAISTAIRLLDMGVDGYLVASAVHAIVAQRLVRRICPECSTEDTLDKTDHAWLETFHENEHPPGPFHKGAGCNSCGKTGYRGRIAVYEILEFDECLAEALRRGDHEGFKTAALAQSGFQPLLSSALQLAEQGVTTLAEVKRVSGWID